MPTVETRGSERVLERIHGEEQVELRRDLLCIAGEGGDPPLAVERSQLVSGATREPLILVHGFAQNRYTWRVSGRSLQGRLAAEGYEVWNLELRGHGRSREYGAGNATDFAQYVDDVRRAVVATGGRPFLIGHSLGVAACIGASTQVPIAGLVNLAGVYTFARANRTIRALAALSLAWEPVLMSAPLRLSTGWAGALIGQLYSISDVAGYGFPIAGWTPDSIERDLLEERLERGFDWTSIEVWLQMCRWARGEELHWAEAFRGTEVPLLVVVGDHDVLVRRVDGEACFREAASADRQILVMDRWDTGVHWGHLDLILGHQAPRAVWPRLVGWLNERSAR